MGGELDFLPEIQWLRRKTYPRHESLVVHRRGEKLSIARSMFPDDQAYETLLRALVDAAQARNYRV